MPIPRRRQPTLPLALLASVTLTLATPLGAEPLVPPDPPGAGVLALAAGEGFGFAFMGFVILVAAAVGHWVWSLRRDFVALVHPGAGPVSTERLALFRDAQAGLPEGSIRAAISLLVVVICLPALVLSKLLGLYSTGELGTILGGVLGFYFGARGGAGESEGFRRQAESFLGQARSQEAAARQAQAERDAAQAARTQAEQAQAAAAAERDAAQAAAEAARQEAATASATGQDRLTALQARAREALSVAQALAALLPAGAARAVGGGLEAAGGLLDQAAQTREAVQAALREPDAGRIATALDAARGLLRRAGEGTELAERLGSALGVLQEATAAASRVQQALREPAPAAVATAAMAAGEALARGAGGGLASVLAPALGAIGSALRLPGLAGLAGAAGGPAAIVGGLLLGAAQAWRLGTQHYARWMARVLDRPVTPDLLPSAAWDGAAARALLGQVPVLARLFRVQIEQAPQQELADLLALLFRPDAVAALLRRQPDGFASELEAEEAVNALRRLVLEAELDRDGQEPVPLPGGGSLPQPAFRATLDRLREAGAGDAIEQLGLLAGHLLRPPPGAIDGATAPADLPALVAQALPEAAALPAARPQDPPPAPPPAEAEAVP